MPAIPYRSPCRREFQ